MAKTAMKIKQQRTPKFSTQSIYSVAEFADVHIRSPEKIRHLPCLLP